MTAPSFDLAATRADFPILGESVRGKPLVYLDNAATSQKPRVVLETLDRFYRTKNANIHRGVHYLSEVATFEYEKARGQMKRFLNASSEKEIVFTRGATEAINLVASSFGEMAVVEGDEIVVSAMEHHSNIVPWQLLCRRRGARLRVIPMTDAGELRLDEYEKLLNERTKLVSIVHVSNSLGTINPVEEMIRIAHARGIKVLVDGAQSCAHLAVDVQSLDSDFHVFSGHKLLGPTGIGVLHAKQALLEEMPPYHGGGDMIRTVSFEGSTFQAPPFKFEAGTPHIAGAIGLGVALEYILGIGFDRIVAWENELLARATAQVGALPGVRRLGTARRKTGVLSFVMDDIHPHDIGTILDRQGIAIRTGHHCCQPVMERLGVPATARASFAFYNTLEEVDRLVEGLKVVRKTMGVA